MQDEKLIANFLYDMKLEGKAASTLKIYANRLSQWLDFLKGRDMGITEASHDDIHKFVNWLHEKKQKNSTIKNELTTVCVFYTWGQKNSTIKDSPVSPADYPTVRNGRIRRLTDGELRQLVAFIDGLQENLRAAFWLMIGTGARVGEVAHLTVTDVSLRGQAVYVDIKDAKWGSDRCIPITDQRAAKIVWQFRQTVLIDNRPLFRVSKRTLQWYATKFAKETGIRFYCHLLRHTYAARLTEKGVPITTIQYLLGHKSIAMTAHYAQSALVDVSGVVPKI